MIVCPRCHARSDTKDTCNACRKVLAEWRPLDWTHQEVDATRRAARRSRRRRH